MEFENDNDLFSLMKRDFYTGVICDTLDELGYRSQAMRENIRPIDQNTVFVGRAKTILASDVYHISDNPYEVEIKAIDSILPNEVVVAATNQSKQNGVWGELLSTAAKMRGANGAIIDGLIRDTRGILDLDFPVYSTGFKPVDSKGRGIVIGYDCPVEVGDVHIKPNDIVFADRDGVVVIPQEVLPQTVEKVLLKIQSENKTRDELLQGKLLKDVYEKYGVL